MNHYMCIHTFTSEKARREYLTPPEKRDPPEKRLTEKEWASFGNSTKATCLQERLGDEECLSAIGTRKAPRRFLSSWTYLVTQV